MQKQNKHFVGLDIGTSHVRCIISSLSGNDIAPTIVGVGVAPNLGVRKGAVVNIQETVSAMDAAIDEAERMSGYQVQSATVNVNGAHILGMNSKGVIAVSAGNREITTDDILRVEEAATVVQLPANREIIQVFSKSYTLDGQENVKDPLGMTGVRLEVEAHVITAATPSLRNIDSAMEGTGTAINSRLLSGLASAEAVINRQQRENGVVVIDFGASTTNIAVLEEGDVQHVAVIPLGSNNITNDLAIGLRTELDIAEEIKIQYRTDETDKSKKTAKKKRDKKLKIKVSSKEHEYSRKEVEMIIQARLDEIFELIDLELDRINRSGRLPGGVILAGGGANLAGLSKYVKDKLRLPVHISSPKGFAGLSDKIDNPQFATAVGLMLHDMAIDEVGGSKSQSIKLNLGAIPKRIIRALGKFKP